ncbi:MAG: NAD-dependent epimerase/dehydratase family protein, partial [Victivallales bacterium]|nr:NAD-dependent epimerase/dehydratase family protein [Victivallales bacterium]
LRSGFLRNIEPFKVEFIEVSVLDTEILKRAMEGVDYVFHLAAMISVPESMGKPVECVQINTIGTLNVLEAAAQAGVKKMTLSTSAAIYGDNPIVPKPEDMFPEPKSPYAETKLSGEYYCGIYTKEGRLNTACLRYFNVFGPRQDPKSQYAAAIPIFISKALRNEPITIFGDGEQTRDFIYVKDIAAANAFFATESPETGVFNVAYGGRITINDLAKKIIAILGSKSEIVYKPVRAGDVKHSTAAIDKLRKAGFKPTSDFDKGLEATVAFFKAQM